MIPCSIFAAVADAQRASGLRSLLDASDGCVCIDAATSDAVLEALRTDEHDLYLIDEAVFDSLGMLREAVVEGARAAQLIVILVEGADADEWYEAGATEVLAWDRLHNSAIERAVRYAQRQARADVIRETEEAVQRGSTELLRAFVEALPGLAFMLDEDGRYVEVFATRDQLLAAPPTQLKGRLLHEVLPQESADLFLATIKKTLVTGRPTQLEYALEVPSGKRWFEGQVAPMIGELNGTRIVVWIAHDVTERKRSQARLAALTDTAIEAVITADAEGRVVGWNEGACRIFGYAHEQILGEPLTVLMPEGYRKAHEIGMERLQETGEPHLLSTTFEIEGLRKNGIVFPIELSLSHWQAGGDTFYGGIIRDITRRKEAEEALVQSEALNHGILSSLRDLIAVLNEEGTIIAINQAWEQAALNGGVAPASVGVGINYLTVCGGDMDPADEVAQAAFDGIRGVVNRMREYFEIEYPCHSPTERHWFRMAVTPFGGGGVVVSHTDITERWAAEEALRESGELLRRLARRLQAVREEERMRLSREVHDVLGQALTGLRMDLAMIEHDLDADRDAVTSSIEAMKEAINETIQVARRIAHDLRPGILDDLGVVAALEWEAQKFEARTGITCVVINEAPDLDLDDARSTALFRVCQEIMTNVARHADASRVEIAMQVQDESFILTVIDNGRGIREEDMINTTSLGLLSMRERLMPWGGRVTFRGAEGEGTVVKVIVPVGEPATAA